MPPFRHTMPVRFADVDHAGIVYYPVFFHYFHIAFEEFFRARLGARSYVELLDTERIGFPAVAAQCEYKAPLRFGDNIDIEMSLERLGTRSITLRYRVYEASDTAGSGAPAHRAAGQEAGSSPQAVLAAEGQTTCAVVNLAQMRAITTPEPLRELFATLA